MNDCHLWALRVAIGAGKQLLRTNWVFGMSLEKHEQLVAALRVFGCDGTCEVSADADHVYVWKMVAGATYPSHACVKSNYAVESGLWSIATRLKVGHFENRGASGCLDGLSWGEAVMILGGFALDR